MVKTMFTDIDFLIFPLHYRQKSSTGYKPAHYFTPSHKAKLGSTDNTETTVTPVKTSNQTFNATP